MGVGGAVLEQYAHPGLALGVHLQLAGGHLFFQAQQLHARLADVDVHGVELLDGGQGRGLLGGDERALGHLGLADAAGDGGLDIGVGEVDAGAVHRCPGRGDLGLGLLPGGLGLDLVLVADRLAVHQLAVAFGLEPGRILRGLGPGQGGAGGVKGGLVHGRIDLVEQLAGLDLGALLEMTLEDDAAHLRPHFGDAEGRGAAGQLLAQADALGREGNHLHLGRAAGRGAGLLVPAPAAGQQQAGQEECQEDGDCCFLCVHGQVLVCI